MSKNSSKLSFHAFEIIDEYIYFSVLNYNGLYRMKIGDNQAEFLETFPNEKLDISHLHGAVKAYERKIYFAPFYGKCLSIFDIDEGNFDSIDLTPFVGKIKCKFYGIQIYERKIILIPSRAKSIIVYDIDSKEIECHSEWIKTVDISINESIPQIKNGSFINGDKLYIPFGKYAAILEIDLNNFEAKAIEFDGIDCGFVDAIFSPEENVVYLLANGKGSIFELKLNTMEVVEYASNEEYYEVPFPYIKMIDMPDRILLIMYQAKYSLLFDKRTHIFEKKQFDVVNSRSTKEWNAYFYTAQRISSDEIAMMGTGDYSISIIDNSCAIKESFTIEDNITMSRMLKNQANTILVEKNDIILEDFLNYVIYKRYTREMADE